MPHTDAKYRDSQNEDLVLAQLYLTKNLLKSQTKVFAENLRHLNASFSRQELVAGSVAGE